MAQYTERLWTQTKDTEQLTFVAGVDLPYRELVKESGPNTNIMVVATSADAIGYVLSPKGVLAGDKVDVQMLYGSPGGGGGGFVLSVTGLDTDNTDPANPVVEIAVDGVTIIGDGTPGNPLVSVGSAINVTSPITGDGTIGNPLAIVGPPTQVPYDDAITGAQVYDANFTRDNSANGLTFITAQNGADFGRAVIADTDAYMVTSTGGNLTTVKSNTLNASLLHQTPLLKRGVEANASDLLIINNDNAATEYSVAFPQAAPVIGDVLTALNPTTLQWAPASAFGTVDSVNPGVDISITGPATDPIVNWTGAHTDSTLTGDGLIGSPLSVVGANLDFAIAVRVATTVALAGTWTYNNLGGVGDTLTRTTNGALPAQDGVTLAALDRLLLWFQVNQITNGVWEVTQVGDAGNPTILTRTTDSDTTSEFDPQVVIPTEGLTLKSHVFGQQTQDPIVGTDNIVYVDGSLYVTQAPAGTQANGQIPTWNAVARQIIKGNNQFTWLNRIFTMNGQLRLAGQIYPPAFNTVQNDYNPANLATSTSIFLTSSGSGWGLTGLAGGAQGRVIFLHNNDALNLTISNQSGSSLVANRFFCPGNTDYVLGPNEGVILQYDSVNTHWHLMTPAAFVDTGVQTVTDDGNGIVVVDNTDPQNPIITFPGGSPYVTIGRTLHVDSTLGNDGTAVVNSLVNKYQTITGAKAASTTNDTIVVWPGVYAATNIAVVSGQSTRIHFMSGAFIINSPGSGPMFNIDPTMIFNITGNALFGAGDVLFRNSSPGTDICTLNMECFQMIAIASNGTWADLTSIKANIRVDKITDMSLIVDGWHQLQIGCDDVSSTQPIFSGGSILNNSGTTYNTTYGQAFLDWTGRAAKKCNFTMISGASAQAAFSNVPGGTRIDRRFYVSGNFKCMNSYAFDVSEGSWIFEGDGLTDLDGSLGGSTPAPFFNFRQSTTDYSFVHTQGYVSANPLSAAVIGHSNQIILMLNEGYARFSGGYYAENKDNPAFQYVESTNPSQCEFDGDFQVSANGSFETFILDSIGTGLFSPRFLTTTGYNAALLDLFGTTTGNPVNLYVAHSLVSNTGYNTGVFTDTSTGLRHYTDTNFVNYIPQVIS